MLIFGNNLVVFFILENFLLELSIKKYKNAIGVHLCKKLNLIPKP